MRTLVFAGLGILIASSAWAGSITVTTTAEQDAALAAMAKQPVKTMPGGGAVPGPTPQSLVQGMVDRQLAGQVNQIKRQAACAKITDAAAKAALGCPQ